jgi:membrane protease YdiL (CAAX protease family)
MAVDASTLPTPGDAIRLRSNPRAFVELAVGYVLIMVVIWTPRAWQRPFYLAAVAWIVVATVLSFDGIRAMGLNIRSSLHSFWIVGVALLFALFALLIAARLHTLHLPAAPLQFVKFFWGYAIWAFMQQFLLQDFFLQRLLRLLPSTITAVVAATALFALAHLPNPILTPITVIWGFAACLHFLRYRNLYPLAIAHAILGISVAITVPGPLDHNMRVGLGYLTYHRHHPRHLSQNDHIVSTAACVTADAPTRRP